ALYWYWSCCVDSRICAAGRLELASLRSSEDAAKSKRSPLVVVAKSPLHSLTRDGVGQFSMSEIAWFRKPSANSKGRGRTFLSYCSFAYSALASFRMVISVSAAFQRVKKSW